MEYRCRRRPKCVNWLAAATIPEVLASRTCRERTANRKVCRSLVETNARGHGWDIGESVRGHWAPTSTLALANYGVRADSNDLAQLLDRLARTGTRRGHCANAERIDRNVCSHPVEKGVRWRRAATMLGRLLTSDSISANPSASSLETKRLSFFTQRMLW